MKKATLLYFFTTVFIALYTIIIASSCAQIGAPTGGAKDTIAPILLKAIPTEKTTNFKGNKIELQFNEYIDVKDIQSNLLVSPYPKTNPEVLFKLKTITIKLKDTLLANTTYSINFGNAIVDNNEGNPFKNYNYVFSTGNTIDSLQLKGNVLMAETGKTDSTLMVLLYKNSHDSAVLTKKPDYMARVTAKGNFTFTNLSSGQYQLFALKDGDGSKTYNALIEPFAFYGSTLLITGNNPIIDLYAYAEEKDKKNATNNTSKNDNEKKLKYTTTITNNTQSILAPLEMVFNKKIQTIDVDKIQLMDSNNQKITNAIISIDSTKKIVSINNNWLQDYAYKLLIAKNAVMDTAKNTLTKNDTIYFKSKKNSDYGSLLLLFTNLDVSKHPVVQFFQNEVLVKSIKITTANINEKLLEPGEYELRILYDTNNNGIWDAGNFKQKLQPEKAITLDKKLSIKANWDNERAIQL